MESSIRASDASVVNSRREFLTALAVPAVAGIAGQPDGQSIVPSSGKPTEAASQVDPSQAVAASIYLVDMLRLDSGEVVPDRITMSRSTSPEYAGGEPRLVRWYTFEPLSCDARFRVFTTAWRPNAHLSRYLTRYGAIHERCGGLRFRNWQDALKAIDEARASYPTPASVLDVPPQLDDEGGYCDGGHLLTRADALAAIAGANSRTIEASGGVAGCLDKPWRIGIELGETDCWAKAMLRVTGMGIGDGYELQDGCSPIRLLRPTGGELARYAIGPAAAGEGGAA
ncbi:MAG TPA: hypothetical protein VIK18_17845 [Pirellulales bacterium]